MALFYTIMILVVWFAIYQGTKKTKNTGRPLKHNSQPPHKPVYTDVNVKLDNRGYEPFDGMILCCDGVFTSIIFGNKDFPITRYIEAPSIEELQAKVDPLLEERREAWLKRKAGRGKKQVRV